jgi:dihydroorotase
MGAARVVLQGGELVDPERRTRARADVAVSGGTIAAIEPNLPTEHGDVAIDVAGSLVTPGLVDMHTHVFIGQDLGVDPDDACLPYGVTTVVDAGSSGGHNFGAFQRSTIERVRTNVRPFLNISSIGTTSILLSGELKTLAYADEDTCASCVGEHGDEIVGIKVRASWDVQGEGSPEPLLRARRVADKVSLPLMVHLGPAPSTTEEILAQLRPGDILTHCCTGFPDNRLAHDGRLRDGILEAQRRGVVFDVGHGMSAFDAEVAASMVSSGFLPDTISTDVHAYSLEGVRDLCTVMSKFLALGVGVDDVIRRVTYSPALAAGLLDSGVGRLRVGGVADIAVLRVVERRTTFVDCSGNMFDGTHGFDPVLTVRDGVVVSDRRGVT